MRVSELARHAGVTAKAVRFYEAEGILPPARRGPNGYRDYGDADLCRLRIVVALRALELSLAECGRLAEMCQSGQCDVMAGDLLERCAERRRDVARRMAELNHLDAELARLEATLQTGLPHATVCLGGNDVFCLLPGALA